MKIKKYFDTRPWYIGHIIGLVIVALVGGNYLKNLICTQFQICLGTLTGTTMIIANIIFYSILAYVYDTLFHSITGLD